MPSSSINTFKLPTYLEATRNWLPTHAEDWHYSPLQSTDTFAAGPDLEAAYAATHIPMSALSQPCATDVVSTRVAPIPNYSSLFEPDASCLEKTAFAAFMGVFITVVPGSFVAGPVLIFVGVIKENYTLVKIGAPICGLGFLACLGLERR